MFQDDEFWDYDDRRNSKLTSMGLGTPEYRAQGCCFLSGANTYTYKTHWLEANFRGCNRRCVHVRDFTLWEGILFHATNNNPPQ